MLVDTEEAWSRIRTVGKVTFIRFLACIFPFEPHTVQQHRNHCFSFIAAETKIHFLVQCPWWADCEPESVSSRSLLHMGMRFCLGKAQWPWASLLSFLVLCSSAVKGGDGLGNSKVLSKFIVLISEKVALAVPFPTSRLEPGSWHP